MNNIYHTVMILGGNTSDVMVLNTEPYDVEECQRQIATLDGPRGGGLTKEFAITTKGLEAGNFIDDKGEIYVASRSPYTKVTWAKFLNEWDGSNAS